MKHYLVVDAPGYTGSDNRAVIHLNTTDLREAQSYRLNKAKGSTIVIEGSADDQGSTWADWAHSQPRIWMHRPLFTLALERVEVLGGGKPNVATPLTYFADAAIPASFRSELAARDWAKRHLNVTCNMRPHVSVVLAGHEAY